MNAAEAYAGRVMTVTVREEGGERIGRTVSGIEFTIRKLPSGYRLTITKAPIYTVECAGNFYEADSREELLGQLSRACGYNGEWEFV